MTCSTKPGEGLVKHGKGIDPHYITQRIKHKYNMYIVQAQDMKCDHAWFSYVAKMTLIVHNSTKQNFLTQVDKPSLNLFQTGLLSDAKKLDYL